VRQALEQIANTLSESVLTKILSYGFRCQSPSQIYCFFTYRFGLFCRWVFIRDTIRSQQVIQFLDCLRQLEPAQIASKGTLLYQSTDPLRYPSRVR
jgi:hypothetical protein